MVRCSELTATCTVENSIYGYFPNLAANVFFTVAFAILGLTQAVLFMRWKTWSYGAVVTIGCVLEMIGIVCSNSANTSRR